MKNISFTIGLALLAGCRQKSTPDLPAKVLYAYPALNESVLPPAPPLLEASKGHRADTNRRNPSELPSIPVTIKCSTGLQIEIGRIERIERLRDYAAQADPDDPFALTEEALEEFSKLDNPILQ